MQDWYSNNPHWYEVSIDLILCLKQILSNGYWLETSTIPLFVTPEIEDVAFGNIDDDYFELFTINEDRYFNAWYRIMNVFFDLVTTDPYSIPDTIQFLKPGVDIQDVHIVMFGSKLLHRYFELCDAVKAQVGMSQFIQRQSDFYYETINKSIQSILDYSDGFTQTFRYDDHFYFLSVCSLDMQSIPSLLITKTCIQLFNDVNKGIEALERIGVIKYAKAL